jgi:hypothetical protein
LHFIAFEFWASGSFHGPPSCGKKKKNVVSENQKVARQPTSGSSAEGVLPREAGPLTISPKIRIVYNIPIVIMDYPYSLFPFGLQKILTTQN